MKIAVLLALCAAAIAVAYAAPARIGSGVNLAAMEFGSSKIPGIAYTNYGVPTAKEVDYYWSLGLRNFRIPFLWNRMQTTLNGTLNAEYFNLYNTIVQYAVKKGATVIIDPHNYGRYNGKVVGASGSGVTAYHFINLWLQLNTKFSNRSDLIIYGLMNEPHGMSSVSWFRTVQLTINALRKAGSQHTIFVPGNGYTGAHSWVSNATWISTDRPVISNGNLALGITDPLNNIVFEVHQYFDSDSSGTNPECPTSRTAEGIFKNFENWLTTNNRYGYLGEFAGANNPACKSIVTAALKRFKSNPRWIGTSWWAGGPWWPSTYMYKFETADLKGQVPQMAWQKANLIPYQRKAGYNPVQSTPISSVNNQSPTNQTGPEYQEPNAASTVVFSWGLFATAIVAAVFF